MQTIIGSGGAIGVELAKALPQYTTKIHLVSRNPQKVNESDIPFSADVTNRDELQKAIQGSEVVYVTVGFPYSYKVWKDTWPPFIRNVIEACKAENAKLVFFDNIYMYDQNHLDGMDENTPINPPSKKGEVRHEIAQMIIDAINSGELKGLIARSADFYGPSIRQTSVLTETVFKPLSQGKKANWMGKDNVKHSFTYTPDAGKATAMLGNNESAYGQVWHLPTASNPPTGKEWVALIAKALGMTPKHQAVPKWMLRIIGIFVPIMREMVEMNYQNERHYVFDSSKFEKAFDFKPTSYEKGVGEIVKIDYSS